MSFRSTKYLVFIATFALFFSCGKSKEKEVEDSISSAHHLLSTKQCQQAIDLLENLGRQNSNAQYLKVLSSAYACRAQYSTIIFFGSDIALTATPAPLGGMTRYSSSQLTFSSPLAKDSNFKDLQTAIDILLYAGGIDKAVDPSSSERAKYFSTNEAGDINSQLVFMMMVQVGRFMKVYADPNAAGVKGGGSGANLCFSDYSNISDNDVLLALANQPGVCKQVDSPHPQLDSSLVSATDRRARLCQGVVLINGILDLLPSVVIAAGGGKLGDIEDVTADITAAKTVLTTAFPAGEVLTVLSQSTCESSLGITDETIESYYAIIMEGLIK
jgi:hypothetical protein